MTDGTGLNDELRPEYDETLLKKNGIVGNIQDNMLRAQTLCASNQMLPLLSLMTMQ